jgi:hypothetical protein
MIPVISKVWTRLLEVKKLFDLIAFSFVVFGLHKSPGFVKVLGFSGDYCTSK